MASWKRCEGNAAGYTVFWPGIKPAAQRIPLNHHKIKQGHNSHSESL
jgi:hypothetical protein